MKKSPALIIVAVVLAVGIIVNIYLYRGNLSFIEAGSGKSVDAPPPAGGPWPAQDPLEADPNKVSYLDIHPPAEPQWWQNAVFYQIWVRSFYDADNDGHGDLAGVAQKIPYLKDLGIDAVWLSPIFEAPSYHGYDVTDFYRIESDYGTMADFDELLRQFHDNGIRVLLDLPVNHISTQHTWFVKAIAGDQKYRDYFIWSDELPAGYDKPWKTAPENSENVWYFNEDANAWYYAAFDYSQPDLNFRNPEVESEIMKAASFWLDKGIDGFRLDAARYIIEDGPHPAQVDTDSTIKFWRRFRSHMKSRNEDAFLIGEVFSDGRLYNKYHDQGRGLDMLFDFEHSNFLKGLILQIGYGHNPGSAIDNHPSQLREQMWQIWRRKYDAGTPGEFTASFAGNHDFPRLTQVYHGDKKKPATVTWQMMLCPGTIFLYYGQEITIPFYPISDAIARRSPMHWGEGINAGFNTGAQPWLEDSRWYPWLIEKPQESWSKWWERIGPNGQTTVEEQSRLEGSMLNSIKHLIELRARHPEIVRPERVAYYHNTGTAWVMRYEKAGKILWHVQNLHASFSAKLAINDLKGEFTDIFSGGAVAIDDELELAGGQMLLLKPVRPEETKGKPTDKATDKPPAGPGSK